jgi:hypothetical protein
MKIFISIIIFFCFSLQAFSCTDLARYVDKIQASRSSALRMAKRDAKIPHSRHPIKVERVPMTHPNGSPIMKDGRRIMTREYHYKNSNGDRIVIQEHTAGHDFGNGAGEGPHFNVRPANDTRHGRVEGTLAHYPVTVD